MKQRISFLQLSLTIAFVICLVVSNIITSKQVLLPFGITMTGAVFIFPITYVLSDLFSEVYGYRWSRITCYMGFVANVFAVIVFTLVIATPSPDHWANQAAYEAVLGNTPRVLVASLAAFLIGTWVNDVVFEMFKRKHRNTHKGFGFRAILSSFCGELIDSLVFLPIAFWGLMPVEALVTMTVCQVFIKTGYEVMVLPITRMIVHAVSKAESAT